MPLHKNVMKQPLATLNCAPEVGEETCCSRKYGHALLRWQGFATHVNHIDSPFAQWANTYR